MYQSLMKNMKKTFTIQDIRNAIEFGTTNFTLETEDYIKNLTKLRKITESELFNIGWKRFGDEELDPYYKIYLKPFVFGLDSLSGNFDKNGNFIIFSIQDRIFTYINEIIEIFTCNKFVIDIDTMQRYGSNKPLGYINVTVLQTPITERYCKIGDSAQLDITNKKIRCSGAWFDYDERWKTKISN